MAFKGLPSSQHQHCTDEAQKAETVLSAVSYIYIYIYIYITASCLYIYIYMYIYICMDLEDSRQVKILKKTTILLNLQNMFRQKLLSSSVDRFTKR